MHIKYRALKIEYTSTHIKEAKMLKNVQYKEESSNTRKCKVTWKIIKPFTGHFKKQMCNIDPDVLTLISLNPQEKLKTK